MELHGWWVWMDYRAAGCKRQVCSQMWNVFITMPWLNGVPTKAVIVIPFTLPAAACERIVGALAHQPSLGGVATSGAAVKGI